MKKKKRKKINPLLGGAFGLGAGVIISLLGAVITGAAFIGSKDPAAKALLCVCISLFLGGFSGGVISAYLSGAAISGIYTMAGMLFIMAAVSLFTPESENILACVLPPVITALAAVMGGWTATLTTKR